jgi:hypothetical protein
LNTLQIFFREFWPPFVGVNIGMSLIWLATRFASDGYLPFIGPKSFIELETFAKDEQKRFLHEACKASSGQWRSFVPFVAFAALLSCGAAMGQTLSKVSALPDSIWVHIVFACFFGVIGGWFATRLQMHYVRPFLKEYIESISPAG